MPINRHKGESETAFISRCISEEVSTGKEADQAAAICYQYLTIQLYNDREARRQSRLGKHIVRWQKQQTQTK